MGGVGRSVHTFRRELFVKFRKSPHRTEKSLRHAQKPANPRSANPIGPESTSVTPGKDPPMATPPKGRKMAPERPFPVLIETGKSHPKTGLLPAVFRRFSDSFTSGLPAVLPAVFRRFSDSFTSGLPAVFRRFSGGFLGGFASGFPAVFRRFSGGSTAVSPTVFSASSPAVFRRFSGGLPATTLPLDQPR